MYVKLLIFSIHRWEEYKIDFPAIAVEFLVHLILGSLNSWTKLFDSHIFFRIYQISNLCNQIFLFTVGERKIWLGIMYL